MARALGGSVTLLTGPSATREAVLAALPSIDLLHFAGHGRLGSTGPLDQRLELAGNGSLGMSDVLALGEVPRNVVLSACELGCAETRPGDERLGMTAALLAAGVGSVVAGVARVDDEVSARVAAAHHRGLAAGLGPARALASAVAGLPEGSPPAPFVCFGSGW